MFDDVTLDDVLACLEGRTTSREATSEAHIAYLASGRNIKRRPIVTKLENKAHHDKISSGLTT